VRHGDGSSRTVVLKDLSRGGTGDRSARLEASFVRDPLREIEAYRDVLAPRDLTAPAFLGAVVDARRGRYWLVLERVGGVPLWQVGAPEVWHAAAVWLAEMHARFVGRTAELPRRLLVHDVAFYRRWLGRTRRFVSWPKRRAHGDRDFDWLASRYLQAARWLAEQPRTFLHGEFYPSNVLVERTEGKARIRPVDWEMAGTGPGLLDLAALTSGAWSETERAALAESYRCALPPLLRPSACELRAGLDRCRLLLSGQWLGWSPRWQPPPEHAHDWLSTALDLAREA
jgi:aminoglycoside phosphotransferase (APT) family kinase protein